MITIARSLAFSAALALLAGCVESTSPANVSVVSLDVQNVEVNFSVQADRLTDRGANIPREQVRADLKNAIRTELAKSSQPDGTPVTVAVSVSKIDLASMASRAVAGMSAAEGTVTVRDANGTAISGPEDVRGTAGALPTFGVFGVITTKSVMDDYRATLAGFARAVSKKVYGG